MVRPPGPPPVRCTQATVGPRALVRLTAAEVTPGGDEPEALVDGPAAELMNAFCGGGDRKSVV